MHLPTSSAESPPQPFSREGLFGSRGEDRGWGGGLPEDEDPALQACRAVSAVSAAF